LHKWMRNRHYWNRFFILGYLSGRGWIPGRLEQWLYDYWMKTLA